MSVMSAAQALGWEESQSTSTLWIRAWALGQKNWFQCHLHHSLWWVLGAPADPSEPALLHPWNDVVRVVRLRRCTEEPLSPCHWGLGAVAGTCTVSSKYLLFLSQGSVNVHFLSHDESFSTEPNHLFLLMMTDNLPQQPGFPELFWWDNKKFVSIRVLWFLAWNCPNKPETQALCPVLFEKERFSMPTVLFPCTALIPTQPSSSAVTHWGCRASAGWWNKAYFSST